MIYQLGKTICFLTFRPFFRIKVIGKENVPQRQGFILASNHVSYLDPPVVGLASPRRLNYMARHDLFSHPVFGWILKHVGAFPVRRNQKDPTALKRSIRLVKEGKGLLVFPEGRRIPIGSAPTRPQAGIGLLAVKSKVPVIPVFVKGTEKALPKGTKSIKPAKVSVHFGRQIHIQQDLPYQEVADQIMEEIRQLGKNS